ncbi:hypothetical protein LTR53_008674 [Teratosphaeriaceae sp. CCFEE 6253]|nr:hypothetical protein LTR53_008674 [Teratosphaeriaceae sp. CCFEE 6253]
MPFTKKQREKSPSSTPLPSTEGAAPDPTAPGLPSAEHDAAAKILAAIYDYRTPDGFDPSKLFHRKVNKRVIPSYYETIKEPVALSTIKQKLLRREYRSFREVVRDFALIPHNAQVFNRSDSGAFQDALVIREQIELQLRVYVENGTISKAVARLPDLGEIPTYEDAVVEEAVDAEEESSGDDDEGEEDDDDDGEELDDEGKPLKKRRGARPGNQNAKRNKDGEDGVPTGKKARGRPPKLLTPAEARIQAIIKGIRKPKNARGQLMIKDFDRLPDKQTMPEYYLEIKSPMAYDVLKRKVKRKKYRSVEDFMADVNLMFNNAKTYNTDDSPLYKHAVALQIEAGRLYDAERAKPDNNFADEDGKIPLPTGILHNGSLYTVGDWIHLQNPNDLTKPIPAQIYRTYKAADGRSMVNVCWYYRPEQTVHRFDKHFYPSEIVKTGRYRDHAIEEVEGKCFVMFFTRYFKGRPRDLAEGQEIYVCEARYNEAKVEFNKIKTWASCLPDEVRDRDYAMDLFDHPRKMRKFPSPIAYLLKDEQKATDDLPKVQWGAEGAPPKIGAVHRRPRGERDSAPPEPTPPPAPKPPTPAPRPMGYGAASLPQQQQQQQVGASRPVGRPPMLGYGAQQQPQQQQQGYASHTAGAPSPAPSRPASAFQQPSSYSTPHTPLQQPLTGPTLPRPSAPGIAAASTYLPQSAHPTTTTSTSTSQHQPVIPPSIPPNPSAYAPARPPTASASAYRDPAPIEVYVLPDQANLSMPVEVREQFARDAGGRVMFFVAPPVVVEGAAGSGEAGVGVGGHSVRYLAEKARRAGGGAGRKRKVRDEGRAEAEREQGAKRSRLVAESQGVREWEHLERAAGRMLEQRLRESAGQDELDDEHLGRWSEAQGLAGEQNLMMAERAARRRGQGAGGFDAMEP